jgi:hypothetical protein
LGLLPKVLHEGVLGTSFMQGPWKESWAQHTRQRKNVKMYFNIIGRSYGFKQVENADKSLEIRRSYWWLRDSIAVVFDLASFREEAPDRIGAKKSN